MIIVEGEFKLLFLIVNIWSASPLHTHLFSIVLIWKYIFLYGSKQRILKRIELSGCHNCCPRWKYLLVHPGKNGQNEDFFFSLAWSVPAQTDVRKWRLLKRGCNKFRRSRWNVAFSMTLNCLHASSGNECNRKRAGWKPFGNAFLKISVSIMIENKHV